MVIVTCACGRLRQERRCNAAKAVTAKGQVQQPQRLPAVTPLSCDDECARLERNRSLAAALGVNIDPSTTTSQTTPQPLSSTNLPYSTETLDMYIQLSSSSPLSTLQNYEETLHSLATSTTQRSVRFQPAKSQLRAFVHSLATDWGFATESFDPEPHRHVFVLKPTNWTPPIFGVGNTGPGIGIGGMSVGECVKVRERYRFKEREAQRLAAAEAKAAKEAARLQQHANGGGGTGGGWAQVASRSRKPDGVRPLALTPLSTGSTSGPFSSTMYAALAADGSAWGKGGGAGAGAGPAGAKKDRLVLRSGVGAGKQLKTQTTSAPSVAVDLSVDVADDWEEAEEKVEQEERQLEEERQHAQDVQDVLDVHGDGEVVTPTVGVEGSADAGSISAAAD